MTESYEIVNIKDFLMVPEDKLDVCLDEFKTFLEVMRPFQVVMREVADGISGKETNLKMEVNKFIWNDDGEKKLTLYINDIEIGDIKEK